MFTHLHDLFALKLGSVIAVASAVVSFGFQSMTGNPNVVTTVITMVGSVAAALGALALKERYEKRRRDGASLLALQRTDAGQAIEREKILDGRVDMIFEKLDAFYAAKDQASQVIAKEKDGVIELLKALNANDQVLIGQQRELIAQQAATLQQLTSGAKA